MPTITGIIHRIITIIHFITQKRWFFIPQKTRQKDTLLKKEIEEIKNDTEKHIEKIKNIKDTEKQFIIVNYEKKICESNQNYEKTKAENTKEYEINKNKYKIKNIINQTYVDVYHLLLSF